MLITYNKVY